VIELTHARITLALHELRTGAGRPLLLLHGLGLRSPQTFEEAWDGPVHALDFTGHGASTTPAGGGYTAEVLIGDVDTAIEHLGEVTLLGHGLGAYVALLTAGARADAVRGAILCDGPGIAGGGPAPGTPQILRGAGDHGPPDPFALAELARDLRPPDYAVSFARLAVDASLLPNPIAVCAKARPDWLRGVCEEPGVIVTTLTDALRVYDPRM
jgi:pimeloyl-ACP methyl ester carboxylesterase